MLRAPRRKSSRTRQWPGLLFGGVLFVGFALILLLERPAWDGAVSLFPLLPAVLGAGLIAEALRDRTRERGPRIRRLPDGGQLATRHGESPLLLAFACTLTVGSLIAGIAMAGRGAWWWQLLNVVGGGACLSWLVGMVGRGMVRLRVTVDRAEAAPGATVTVRWDLRAPFGVNSGDVMLVGRERLAIVSENTGDVEHIIYTDDIGTIAPGERHGQARVVIPADLMHSHRGPSSTVEWLISVSADLPLWPDLEADCEIAVGPPPARVEIAEPAAALPTMPPEGLELGLAFDGGNTAYAPGESIAGVVGWTRDSAPARAELQLRWRATGRGLVEDELIGVEPIAELPRVNEPAAPLAPIERRRFRFTAPDRPSSYRGTLFAIRWTLAVTIDGQLAHEVDLVIGPARAPIGVAVTDVGESVPSS